MRQAIAWTNVDPAQGDMGQIAYSQRKCLEISSIHGYSRNSPHYGDDRLRRRRRNFVLKLKKGTNLRKCSSVQNAMYLIFQMYGYTYNVVVGQVASKI